MISADVKIGTNVIIYHPELVNLYGCEIGDGTKIASFVEIGKNVKIGKNCKIEAFAFIPEGVVLEDDVFIGPHVCFTNDRYPKVSKGKSWDIVKTVVKINASIGANATVICGITIGQDSTVAAGSVVTKDVPPKTLVIGNPAKIVNKTP